MNRREFLAGASSLAVSKRLFGQAEFALPFDRASDNSMQCRLALPRGVDAGSWQAWVREHDRQIRARLRQGEGDSLANLVLFGNSFTNQPRATAGAPDPALIEARVGDFMRALDGPRLNERIDLVRNLIPSQRGAEWVRANVERVLTEQRQFQTVLDRAPGGDATASTIYRNRGLSIDTNFRPNFAIELALNRLKQPAVLDQVKRAAIIGPGLDFTDKDSGFDYYPLQTLQPFALIDSLFRLGLADERELGLTVFDISPLTLNHLIRAKGKPYIIQLVLPGDRKWTPATRAYWRHFIDGLGARVPPMTPPKDVNAVDRRAIQVRREVVDLIEPRDLNVITQREAGMQFDLVVATNVLVYYDAFEQGLAMANLEAMLRPGGVLLTNTALPNCAAGNLHETGNAQQVRYSDLPSDEDTIDSYVKSALGRPLAPR